MLFGLWLLLSRFDEEELRLKAVALAKTEIHKQSRPPKALTISRSAPKISGIGYSIEEYPDDEYYKEILELDEEGFKEFQKSGHIPSSFIQSVSPTLAKFLSPSSAQDLPSQSPPTTLTQSIQASLQASSASLQVSLQASQASLQASLSANTALMESILSQPFPNPHSGNFDPTYGWGKRMQRKEAMEDDIEEDEEESPDSLMKETLKLLAVFLPMRSDSTSSPTANPELAILRLSFFLDKVIELVRNDSISYMKERCDLYHCLFDFLEFMLGHPRLLKLAFEQRIDKKHSPGLRALSSRTLDDGLPSSTGQSSSLFTLFTCMKYSNRQALVFLKLEEKHEGSSSGLPTSRRKKSVRLCKRIVNLYNIMEASNGSGYCPRPDSSLGKI